MCGGSEGRGRKVRWETKSSENRSGSVPLVYSALVFQKSEHLSLASPDLLMVLRRFLVQNSDENPFPERIFKKLVPCLTRLFGKEMTRRLQKSGSVFVCWLVCWWDWVYWANWFDWCVDGWLAAVWFACWFSDWYCSSSRFLLMADCSCCLITRIWPSNSDSSWTSEVRPPLRPGPQSPTPKLRHWDRPCPEPPCPGPSPCPSARPNRSERPFEVVTMCFSSKGTERGWVRGEGGGGGGRSWEVGCSRSFCISWGRILRLLQWEESAGFQDADRLFPSLHLERRQIQKRDGDLFLRKE